MSDKNPQEAPRSFYEEISVAGNQLLERINTLVSEGNIRRLIIKDNTGRTLLEVPLTLGVVAGTSVALFAPFLAAVGAIAALVAQVRIVVERYENPADADKEQEPTVAEVRRPDDKK
jgi:uncharacterized membrane protein